MEKEELIKLLLLQGITESKLKDIVLEIEKAEKIGLKLPLQFYLDNVQPTSFP